MNNEGDIGWVGEQHQMDGYCGRAIAAKAAPATVAEPPRAAKADGLCDGGAVGRLLRVASQAAAEAMVPQGRRRPRRGEQQIARGGGRGRAR